MNNSNKIYINKDDFYTILRIKSRIVFAPNESLKKKQRYILNAIKWVYPYKTDILETVKIHQSKKWILKTDIKDFFGSTPQAKIQKVIQKVCRYTNKDEEFIKYYILTTLNDKLPTGASTSSHIANACFIETDNMIKNVCRLYYVNYSRYVDDLTFSADNKQVLKLIEKRVSEILEFEGYKLNKKKAKYISDNKQQNILGLVVNGNKTRLSNDFKKTIRVMLHKFCIMKINFKAYNSNLAESRRIQGYFSYIKQVDYPYFLKLIKYKEKLIKKYNVNF